MRIRKSFILLILILCISGCNKRVEVNTKIDEYSTKTYYGYIIIPKIDFKKGFFNDSHPLNDVNKNILFINPMPNTYIFAAHSGIGNLAYFNDLKMLELKDEIYIEINDLSIKYEITKIDREKKTGSINIPKEENIIVLTTCDQIIKDYQLVILGKKVLD